MKFLKIINNQAIKSIFMAEKTNVLTDENIRTLVGLGLSSTQAKISLALARIGPSTVSEISDASAVARPDTYRALVELEKKGLIEKIVSTPNMYELIPLSEVLSTINWTKKN